MSKIRLCKTRPVLDFLINILTLPFIREFPFVVICMLLMGTIGVLQMIHGRMLAPENYPPYLELFSWIGEMFLISYAMAAVVVWTAKKWIKIIFYTLALWMFAVQEFLKANFNWMITPAVLTMAAETTAQESSEFVSSFINTPGTSKLLLVLAFNIIGIITAEYLYNRYYLLKNNRQYQENLFVLLFVIPLLSLGAISLRKYYSLFDDRQTVETLTSQLEDRFSINPISRTFFSIGTLNCSRKSISEAVNATISIVGSKMKPNCPDSLNLVFVVGESYIKWHSQLYGYYLHTTPQLAEEQKNGNLLVFTNVVTPYNHTSESLKNIFSCNSLGDSESWHSAPFFPAVFRQAGFEVSFWDNQRNVKSMFDTWSFTLDGYLYNPKIAEVSYDYTSSKSYPYDEGIVDVFSENTGQYDNPHKLIIFHLMGQHLMARERFPHSSEFLKFTKDSITRKEPWLTDEKKQMIADYDNATFYNDYVLSKIMDMFRDTNTILVYLTDHGEEVYDYRDRFGRNHSKDLTEGLLKYQFEIPFLLWCSNSYKDKNPQIINAIRSSLEKPFMIDNVCQLLFDLGYIQSPCYKEERDILSDNYKCPPRLLRGSFNYDLNH